MYPISFIFDSLRNNVRRFDTTIEADTQDSVELTRIVDRVSTAEANLAKYIKASLVVLGLGLLSVAALRDDNAPDITTLQGPMYFPGHLEIGKKGNFLGSSHIVINGGYVRPAGVSKTPAFVFGTESGRSLFLRVSIGRGF
jgi:hypothetical protein